MGSPITTLLTPSTLLCIHEVGDMVFSENSNVIKSAMSRSLIYF